MTIQELKTDIELNQIKNSLLIFLYSDNAFLADQYTKEIARCLGRDIEYLENLNSISSDAIDIFFSPVQDVVETLRVYRTDKFSHLDEKLMEESNLIVVANKIEPDSKIMYQDYIVEMPKLQSWQIKDYIYSILKGIDTRYLDWLITNCKEDIYRLQAEADKLTIFNEKERSILFQCMVEENAFSDITSQTIFDFTDSIVKKNKNQLIHVYEDIENIDIEAIGLVTVLYQNFRKLIQVWMDKNPTPETTGLSSKQIYAINKLPRVWSQHQLISVFEFLTSVDFKIKTGNMPMDILRDYMVVKMLSM